MKVKIILKEFCLGEDIFMNIETIFIVVLLKQECTYIFLLFLISTQVFSRKGMVKLSTSLMSIFRIFTVREFLRNYLNM